MNRRNVSHNFYIVAIALSVPLMVGTTVRAQNSPVDGTTTGGASTAASAAAAATSAKNGSAAAVKNGTPAEPPSGKVAGAISTSTLTTTVASPSANAGGLTVSTPAAPRKKIIFTPGMELSIGTSNETIKVTNDAKLAKAQVDSNADSPEAHFVYAVALTRTSQVEEALKEIRTARKLSGPKGGAVYFDSMIAEYEDMLKNYPEDNQIRYHLAWAYYMKAYVLARYSKQVAAKPPAVAVANATAAVAATPATPASTSAAASKNWQSEFVSQNSVLKPDELVEPENEPSNKGTGEKTTQDSSSKDESVVSKDSKDSTELKASKKSKGNRHTKDAKISQDNIAKDYVNLGEEATSETKSETAKATFTPPTVPPVNAAAHGGNKNFWANPLGNLPNLGPITGMEYATANAAPEVIPQVKAYYRRALKKLDEVIEREPDDMFANLYRAHLKAEYSGDIDSAMKVWESCRDAHPNSPAPYFFLGEGYLKKGNLGQCLSNVSKAIALRSTGN